MQAKISTLSVHQDGGSRINRHKPERFTHRLEKYCLWHQLCFPHSQLFTFVLFQMRSCLLCLLHLMHNAIGSFV